MKKKLSEIRPAETNPRYISEVKLESLKKSIQDFPEMLELRPLVIDETGMILGGNMRYKALLDLGIKETFVTVAKNLTEKQKREFVIKDNTSAGEWDWEALASEWESSELKEWGVDVWSYEAQTEPPTETGETTEDDMKKAGEKMGQVGTRETLEITCPHCGEIFEINKP